MKLIHWVEAHIGRSRRSKTKKDRGKDDGSRGAVAETEEDSQEEQKTPVPECRARCGPPVHPTPENIQKKPSDDAPSPAKEGATRKLPSIRTSFLESTSVGVEAVSPRQRSLIRTNPWLPSPRSSCDSSADSGLACVRSSSSSGSDGSDISVFDSQRPDWSSLCSLRTPRDFARNSNNPRSIASLERVGTQQRAPLYVRDTRSLPRGEWLEAAKGEDDDDDDDTVSESSDDSDEAYSEESKESTELEQSVARMRLSSNSADQSTTTEAPSCSQADSAFVSDASCTTSPLSETQESLQIKVQRLLTERSVVERKMQEAREEDRMRREDRLHLQSELMKHRRAVLLHTLRQLREELEMQSKRLQVACSATWEVRSQRQRDSEKNPE